CFSSVATRREYVISAGSNPAAGTCSGTGGTVNLGLVPLGAARAKRLDFDGARIVQELPVLRRFNGDQRDFAVGVVVDAPTMALCERRHAKVRVAFAQELLPFCRPDCRRDVMNGGVYLEGNVLFGVGVRVLGEQFVLNHCLCLLASSGFRHVSLGSRTVV